MSFKIGDLTILKNTNSDLPYKDFVKLKNDLPVMVVEEIQTLNKTEFRPEDGVAKSEKGSQNCKCIWYNFKQGEFKEEWINSKYLTMVPSEANPLVEESKQDLLKDKIGMSVRLANHDIESRKLIEVGFIENSNSTGNYKMVDKYNEFCAPEMIIIDVKSNEKEQDNFDKKTGKKIREVSKNLVKCKWYNKSNNKYSERYFPYLLLIENSIISGDILKQIQSAIEENKYLKIPEKDLYKPLHILNNGGNLQLRAYNYIVNREELFDLKDLNNITSLDDFFISEEEAPAIKKNGKKHDLYTVNDLLDKIKRTYSNFALRIGYKNLNNEFKYHSLNEIKFFQLNSDDEINETTDSIEKKILYVEGYHLEKERRMYYRVSRIKFAWILNYESK